MAEFPDEEVVDYRQLAYNLQIENEVLRREKKRAEMLAPKPMDWDVLIRQTVSWIDSHPYVAIVMCYIISTLIMDLVELVRRK